MLPTFHKIKCGRIKDLSMLRYTGILFGAFFFLGIVGALLRMIKKEIFGNGFRYVSCNNIKAVEKPEYRVRTSRLTHLPLSE